MRGRLLFGLAVDGQHVERPVRQTHPEWAESLERDHLSLDTALDRGPEAARDRGRERLGGRLGGDPLAYALVCSRR
ncbi:MAG TPA: hypothetical protein VF317_03890 [Dermatophilaceae bacterium]